MGLGHISEKILTAGKINIIPIKNSSVFIIDSVFRISFVPVPKLIYDLFSSWWIFSQTLWFPRWVLYPIFSACLLWSTFFPFLSPILFPSTSPIFFSSSLASSLIPIAKLLILKISDAFLGVLSFFIFPFCKK